jgi:hypothetical protein
MKVTFFFDLFTVSSLKNLNWLIEFSEPLAQSQGDWWAFGPESVTNNKNLQLNFYGTDFFCEFSFSIDFFASTCTITESISFSSFNYLSCMILID